MSIEKRMDEFKKVADKQNTHDVSKQMDEFKEVIKMKSHLKQDISGELPYHIKRYKICDRCGEPMEIQEINKDKAIYYCATCQKGVKQAIEK